MKPVVLALCAALALTACSRGDNADELFNGTGSGAALDAAAGQLSALPNPNGIDQNSIDFLNQVIGDRVLFEVDQSTLTPSARQTLDLQAAWLIQRPGLSVTIEGHADEQGTRDYNLRLSQRRAAAVRDYMVTKGLPDGRLSIIPFGKERPIEVCSNERCWSQNRRAVTVAAGSAGV